MHPFQIIDRPNTTSAAGGGGGAAGMFIAGGTDMVQLLRVGVITPDTLTSLQPDGSEAITRSGSTLRIPALATMAAVAAEPLIRAHAPAIAEALLAAASPQIRNLGTAGGNLLQRTRCVYFRDTAFPCNKRAPGSGCPAIAGRNRELAILGGSEHCIATHPSDMPVALMAFDAVVETSRSGGHGARRIPLAEFYLLPGDTPERENVLEPGEAITAIIVPTGQATRRSTYVKVRDRQSYAYALASVAAGMSVAHGRIADVRLAAGGVASKPWRLHAVEAALRGRAPSPDLFASAARLATEGAAARSENGFKETLLVNVVRRALEAVAA